MKYCVECQGELIPLRMINTLTNDDGVVLTKSDVTIAHYCVDLKCTKRHLLQLGEATF